MAIIKTQDSVQETRRRAADWANQLKFKEAALDLFALIFILPSYLVGLTWYFIKYCVGLLVEGFKKGARHPET
jgi:hypothetical protein